MRFPTLALSLATLTACSTTDKFRYAPNTGKPITIAEYKVLASTKRPKARAYQLAFKVVQRGDTLSAPKIVTKPGQRALIEIIREFRYPVAFEIPRAGKGNALTPATPTVFETTNTGLSIDVTPNADGAFIVLTGEATQTTFDGFHQNAGEAFRPITSADGTIISPNAVQSPTFTTRRTPFLIAALPGHTYRFPMNADKKTTIEVTCAEVR